MKKLNLKDVVLSTLKKTLEHFMLKEFKVLMI